MLHYITRIAQKNYAKLTIGSPTFMLNPRDVSWDAKSCIGKTYGNAEAGGKISCYHYFQRKKRGQGRGTKQRDSTAQM